MILFAVLFGLGTAATAQQGNASALTNPAGSTANAALVDLPDAQTVTTSHATAGQESSSTTGSIHGVIVDGNGSVYEGAHVALALTGQPASESKETISDSNGRFNFADVPPGAFKLTITSSGFALQVVAGTLHSGESYEAKEIVLVMDSALSVVQVTATQQEIAQEELKLEETQRVFGVIPNFYVVYAPNAPPLNPKQKFNLAWRSLIDPVTFLGVGLTAGIEQATNTYSGYGQGTQGYAKRFGASYADGSINTIIGAGILASWWKQDPRYFQKGTGTIRSRALYAIANAVICKGDNGHWQTNYSGIMGGLAAGGISNLYYPASSRSGVELIFENSLIGAGEGAIQNLIQEFVIRRLTPHVPNYGAAKP